MAREGEALERFGELGAGAGFELFAEGDGVGEGRIGLSVPFLFQAEDAKIVFGDGEFDDAIGAEGAQGGDGFDHELLGEGEFVVIHEDESFLAKEGSDAGMVGAEELFVEGAGFAEDGQRAGIVPGGTMGLADAGIGEGDVQTVFAGGFDGDGERLLRQGEGIAKLVVADHAIGESFESAGGLDIGGEEFAFHGEGLAEEGFGAVGRSKHQKGAGEEVHVGEGAVVPVAETMAVQGESIRIDFHGCGALAFAGEIDGEIQERAGEVRFELGPERAPDVDGFAVERFGGCVLRFFGKAIALVIEGVCFVRG